MKRGLYSYTTARNCIDSCMEEIDKFHDIFINEDNKTIALNNRAVQRLERMIEGALAKLYFNKAATPKFWSQKFDFFSNFRYNIYIESERKYGPVTQMVENQCGQALEETVVRTHLGPIRYEGDIQLLVISYYSRRTYCSVHYEQSSPANEGES